MTNYPHLRLRNKEERRLLDGHLWAFSNELIDIPKDLPAGTIVTLVREKDGTPIGNGFFHPHSLIAFRLLTRDPNEALDGPFFEHRIREAAARRGLLLQRRNAVRLVHGESDLLPGLLVDRFGPVLSYQIVSAGFEARKDMIVDILKRVFEPSAIVEKNNSHLRKREELPVGEAIVYGTDSQTEIHDAAGTKYAVDILKGQKTGFFLDQMDNRTRLRDFVRPGARVLDLFANDGGFGLNAALAGAASAVAVDESRSALSRIEENARLNNVADRVSTIEADCFTYLREAKDEADVIIVDPPALAKSKKDLPQARKGYITLNTNAMRLASRDSVIVTCSCSHHLSGDDLMEVVRESAKRSKRTVTVLERRGAGIDHPILAAMPETEYLKVLILGVR